MGTEPRHLPLLSRAQKRYLILDSVYWVRSCHRHAWRLISLVMLGPAAVTVLAITDGKGWSMVLSLSVEVRNFGVAG